jgi:hypothetical protein
MRASYSSGPLGWIILGMHPPAEQLIRDYLNRLSVAARGRLGMSQRQSLLDRTRARIEAECGGTKGASALHVRKTLADLGDPIVLVEREAVQAGSGTATADTRYEPSVKGNGIREMAARQAHANNVVKGSEIGEDLLVTGGPNASKSGRGGGSVRSLLAGLTATKRRRRRAGAANEPVARATSRGGSGAGQGGRSGAGSGGGSGAPGHGPSKPSLVPAPRPPASSEKIGSPDLIAVPASGRLAGPGPGGPGPLGRLIRGVVAVTRSHTLEVLAIVLLGVGGAAYPPIWLVGAALALPSKKWDIRDKFFGVTLPVFLLVIGTVLILVFGGQHDSITAYAYEAWLGGERLSRVLAVAGAAYLAGGLRRGRRQPKQPPWNVPHRFG